MLGFLARLAGRIGWDSHARASVGLHPSAQDPVLHDGNEFVIPGNHLFVDLRGEDYELRFFRNIPSGNCFNRAACLVFRKLSLGVSIAWVAMPACVGEWGLAG